MKDDLFDLMLHPEEVVAGRVQAVSKTGAMVITPPKVTEITGLDPEKDPDVARRFQGVALGGRYGLSIKVTVDHTMTEEQDSPAFVQALISHLTALTMAKTIGVLVNMKEPEIPAGLEAAQSAAQGAPLVDQNGAPLSSELAPGGPDLMNCRPSRLPAWLSRRNRG